jgi:hypothetical protein
VANRRPGRRGARQSPRVRFLICCEGRITETEYFTFVRSTVRGTVLEISVAGDLGDPLNVVTFAANRREEALDAARAERDSFIAYEQVWAVVDVDDHARLPAALAEARRQNINVAISNPCFELWPILHFASQTAHVNSDRIASILTPHIPGYDKHLDCSALLGRYQDAKRRALGLDDEHVRAGRVVGANPSTGVWRVNDALLQAASTTAEAVGL